MGAATKIKGSTAVITGASSGIGRATAHRLAHAGADLMLVARGAEALEEAAGECREYGVEVLPVSADMTDEAAVHEAAARAVRQFGRIDVWVNNAGVSLFGPFLDTPAEDFQRVLDVNIMGYVHGAQAALRQMRRQDRGVLINVSSVVGEVAQPFTPACSMTKAGINALSVSLRSELELEGIRDIHVTTVLPSTVDTPLFDRAANYTGRRILPMPPVYSPERAAKVILTAAQKPKDQAAVGRAAQGMMRQHRSAPAATERMMAEQVDKKHLSQKRPAEASTGSLHSPPEAEDHGVHGGWGGRRHQGARRAATAAVMLGAAAAAVAAASAANKANGRRTA